MAANNSFREACQTAGLRNPETFETRKNNRWARHWGFYNFNWLCPLGAVQRALFKQRSCVLCMETIVCATAAIVLTGVWTSNCNLLVQMDLVLLSLASQRSNSFNSDFEAHANLCIQQHVRFTKWVNACTVSQQDLAIGESIGGRWFAACSLHINYYY